MTPSNSNITVVGAGPTGLALAVALGVRGVKCCVLDCLPAGQNTSRAAVVHARTLEVLAPLGVSDPLIAAGLRVDTFSVRDRDRVLMDIRFAGLQTPYPFTLMVPQATTERILLRRLGELGGEVFRPVTVTGLANETDTVTASLADGTSIASSWLVGADGMHSIVRDGAGIPFTGGQYQESFLLADIRGSGGLTQDQIILHFSPAGMLVLAPLPDGVHRVVATLDDAPENPAPADVQALLDTRGPRQRRAVVDELIWGSRFRVHHRVADTYRGGRILLAGDAAHVHSPAGGQGMNTGIQDAIVLADALIAALDGDQTGLDRYDTVRRDIADRVVRTADTLTRLATMAESRRRARNLGLSLAGSLPLVPRRIARQLSGLAYR